jgi:ribosomal subunit interface protein
MAIEIHSKGIDLLEEEKAHAQEKAEKILHISRNAENDESIKVKFEIEKENGDDKKHQFLCTITLDLPGKVLRSESHNSGVYAAIDEASKKMKTQFKKEKELHKHI